ncbi:hypothetical protein AGMMS49938_06000 [Fibrobacterales bacterium]|nr:hypothetical protein AGMMS49938_06000 [Fibrobacterales bacterium]
MQKLNLLFDINDIVVGLGSSTSTNRSIFYVAHNIFMELQKQNKFNITLYLNCSNKSRLKNIKDPFWHQFPYIVSYGFERSEQVRHIRQWKNFNILETIGRIFAYLYFFVLDLPFACNKKSLHKMDVFFSPYELYPNLNKYANIKKFYLLHDTIALIYQNTNARKAKNFLAKYSGINRNDIYFCNSESTKKDFLRFFDLLLDVKNCFITPISAAQTFTPLYDYAKAWQALKKYGASFGISCKYMFSLSTAEPRKNLLFTIACFCKFIEKNQISDFYFCIGGSSKSFDNLRKKISNDFADKIVFLGFVDDADVNTLYSNSLFFAYISQYEGFGMNPLEAMQAGVPVITSDNSSLPEVVGDAAITIDCSDESACIKAFEDLYFSENLRKQYIDKGLKRAKLFSWENTVNKMTEIIYCKK